jgi:hypothetical protein
MDSSDSDSAIAKVLVRCICTRRCGGPGQGKLISTRSRQRHALREPKELPASFVALQMQHSKALPAAGAAASAIVGKPHLDSESAANVDQDPAGTGGSLRDGGEDVFNDVVCYPAVISDDLYLFRIGYA